MPLSTSLRLPLHDSGRDNPAPVFGVQASWVCYRRRIVAAYHHDRAGEFFLLPDPSDYADVAFLFLNQEEGAGRRIICPAIGYDRAGEFKDVWSRFIRAADNAATIRTGLAYEPSDPVVSGKGDSLITTAWRGETAIEKARVE